MTYPPIPISTSGRRPVRSDQRPHTGAKNNCPSAYTPVNKPTWIATDPRDAPSASARRSTENGSTGNVIPKPTMTTKTQASSAKRCFFIGATPWPDGAVGLPLQRPARGGDCEPARTLTGDQRPSLVHDDALTSPSAALQGPR